PDAVPAGSGTHTSPLHAPSGLIVHPVRLSNSFGSISSVVRIMVPLPGPYISKRVTGVKEAFFALTLHGARGRGLSTKEDASFRTRCGPDHGIPASEVGGPAVPTPKNALADGGGWRVKNQSETSQS